MTSKRTKEHKDIQDEAISKEDFLDMFNRLTKIEMDMKKWVKDTETHKKKDREEKDALKAEIEQLKVENTDLKKQLKDIEVSREDGEISSIEDIKDEIKKVKEEVNNNIELAKTGWVDVVKRNIKKEIKDENIVNTTLEEEKMRQARRLNVRVTGLKEGASPNEDAQTLGKMLGYTEALPITKAWRAGRDTTRKRALVLQFKDLDSRITFFKKRPILRGLGGDPIYLDEDLTKMQIEHRKSCMPRVMQARKEGHRAFYRDGRVIINDRTTN